MSQDPKNYDPACEDLARHMLGENASEAKVRELAEAFQWQAELFSGFDDDDEEADAA